MRIKYECKFFKGNLPCVFHKEKSSTCDNCEYYRPKSKKILIIKLLAIGDVLRTTSILNALRQKFKDAYIIWLTHPDAKPLLFDNELIDEVMEYNLEAISRIMVERFDLVFNPSNERSACILATLARAKKKFGFVYNPKGFIQPLDSMARYYLEMATNDAIKKKNRLTYQEIIFGMLGLKDEGAKPLLRLTEAELAYAQEFKKKYHWDKQLVVGLNTGAGMRWPLKRWPVAKTAELARRIQQELKARLILFGGPQEIERNRQIMLECQDFLLDAGCQNSLREFASLINLTDIMVSSDTLALHIAVALNKYVVGLFGPTSYAEVELYNYGKKIYAAGLECLSCYKNSCTKQLNCMDEISVDEVLRAIKEFKEAHA